MTEWPKSRFWGAPTGPESRGRPGFQKAAPTRPSWVGANAGRPPERLATYMLPVQPQSGPGLFSQSWSGQESPDPSGLTRIVFWKALLVEVIFKPPLFFCSHPTRRTFSCFLFFSAFSCASDLTSDLTRLRFCHSNDKTLVPKKHAHAHKLFTLSV